MEGAGPRRGPGGARQSPAEEVAEAAAAAEELACFPDNGSDAKERIVIFSSIIPCSRDVLQYCVTRRVISLHINTHIKVVLCVSV